MSGHDPRAWTRRAFLQRGVTLASAAATVPWFLDGSASALAQMMAHTSSIPGVPDERVLVVIQLSGGNDGLNTVVPHGMPEYYNARGAIAVPEREVIRLDRSSSVGLHPRLTGLKSLYDDGLLSVVQGVGYPNPNRSHFKSMDIWHTAKTSGVGDGWLGRYIDNECAGAPGAAGGKSGPNPQSGVAIGRATPLAMQGRRSSPVTFENADLFRWSGEDLHESLREPYEQIVNTGAPAGFDPESSASFLMRTALDARVAGETIRKASASTPMVEYPPGPLAQQLALVAAMIRSGMKTRVYFVSLGGFDTHAAQGGTQGRHANLLGFFGDALRAFYADLRAQRDDGRVLSMVFSEFGRRVAQNASNGTDHGAAAPMFLAGPMVRPGLLGEHPSLRNLEDGDMRFTVDFRSVYAGILQDWLKADATAALGGRFRPAKLVRG